MAQTRAKLWVRDGGMAPGHCSHYKNSLSASLSLYADLFALQVGLMMDLNSKLIFGLMSPRWCNCCHLREDRFARVHPDDLWFPGCRPL